MTVALCALPTLLLAAESPSAGEWPFRVFLDDQPIGEHRFSVRADGSGPRGR